MEFLDLTKLRNLYPTGIMKDCIDMLEKYKAYHCLLAGDYASFSQTCGFFRDNIPAQFRTWTELCNGGLLFDTSLLSTEEYVDDVVASFETFSEFNCLEAKDIVGIPDGYTIFGIRSYGDPLCFDASGIDPRVYLWNVEKAEFEQTWESFEAWLYEEISDAVTLIGEGVLEPFGVTIGGEADE